MGRAEYLTKMLKSFDRQLYCAKNGEGKLCVYRNSIRWEDYELPRDLSNSEGTVILRTARPAPFFIFALTEDWKPQGRPIDYGYDQILDRLRAHDMWNRDLIAEQEKQYDKAKESADKESLSKAEDFAREIRPQFKKAFSDVNTSSMSKKVERVRKDEEKFKRKEKPTWE